MADPTTIDMLMGAGGGGAGTGIVGFALYKILGKNNGNSNSNSNGNSDRLEGKMDQMIENQHDGNLILAKIEGLLSNK